jgi:hypothetical protein
MFFHQRDFAGVYFLSRVKAGTVSIGARSMGMLPEGVLEGKLRAR